jgi:hypothetical protein
MDIDSLAKGVGLFSTALGAIKQVIALLPESSKKAEAVATLERAEREFKLAEATAANELGYEICRKHFPPEIMLSSDSENWECPVCHNIKKPDDYGIISQYLGY